MMTSFWFIKSVNYTVCILQWYLVSLLCIILKTLDKTHSITSKVYFVKWFHSIAHTRTHECQSWRPDVFLFCSRISVVVSKCLKGIKPIFL